MAFLRDLLTRIRVQVQAGGVRQLNAQFESAKAGARGFDKGLQDVTSQARNLQNALAGGGNGGLLQSLAVMRRSLNLGAFAAAIGGGAFAAYVNNVRNTIDAVGKQSAQLGVSTSSFQVLTQFAGEAGLAQQDVVTAFRAMSKQAEQFARTGKGEAEPAFRRLGISMAEVAKLSADPEELFFRLGGQLGELTNFTERSAVAQRLFGESGAKLIPGFKAGTAAAEAQRKELRELAVVYDDELVPAIEAMNDRWSRQMLQFKRIGAAIIKQLIPAFDKIGEFLGPFAKLAAKATSESNFYAAALIGLATAFGTATLRAMAFQQGMFSLAGLKAVFAGINSGIGGALKSFAKLALIAAIIATVLLVLEDMWVSIQGGDGYFKDFLTTVLGAEDAIDVLNAMAAALNAVGKAAAFLAKSLLTLLGFGKKGERFWSDLGSLAAVLGGGSIVTAKPAALSDTVQQSLGAFGRKLESRQLQQFVGMPEANVPAVVLTDQRTLNVQVSTPDGAQALDPISARLRDALMEDRRHMLENLSPSGSEVQ